MRVYVGQLDQRQVYKMGEVQTISRGGTTYKFHDSKGGRIATTVRLSLAIGNHVKKGVKIGLISNSK